MNKVKYYTSISKNTILVMPMVHLAAFTQLETLNLIRTRVTDAGLRQIQGLSRLEML